MAQLVNTILISVVAFFVFLAVFGYFGGMPKAATPPPSAPRLTHVAAQWAQPDHEVPRIGVDVTVHNPTHDAVRVVAARYAASANGVAFDEGTQALDTKVPGDGDATVHLLLRVPSSAIPLWWPAYGAAGESSGLAVSGALDVQDSTDTRTLPFDWTSSWQGGLAHSLAQATVDCPPADAVCLSAIEATWQDGNLHVRLQLRNQGANDITTDGGTSQLELGGVPVAEGSLDGVSLAPGESAWTEAVLQGDAQGLAEWFPGHVARCESSPVHWSVQLTPNPDAAQGDWATGAAWSLAGTFETHLLCGVRP